ncbi:hypothetical protein ACM66B_000513 [Microbotryomycetes sp. NB124-2]
MSSSTRFETGQPTVETRQRQANDSVLQYPAPSQSSPSTSSRQPLSIRPGQASHSDARPGRHHLTHPATISFPPLASSVPTSLSHLPPPQSSEHVRMVRDGRRCCSNPSATRPRLEPRPCSTTYTSLPCEPPKTPGDEEDDSHRKGLAWPRWLWHSSEQDERDVERQPLLTATTKPHVNQEDLPKVTRQCLVAEIKCYGKYMLPPILVFVILAISIAMFVYGKAIHSNAADEREANATTNLVATLLD